MPSYQFNRVLMNEQIGFLKVPVSLVDFVHLFSPSFSATTVLSALFFAPSSSFYVAMYALVSLVDSFVGLGPPLFSLALAVTSSITFVFLFLSFFLSHCISDSFSVLSRAHLFVSFLPLFFYRLFAHLRPSLTVTVPPSLPLRALLFSSRLRRVSFALRLQRFPPLNYARNYA